MVSRIEVIDSIHKVLFIRVIESNYQTCRTEICRLAAAQFFWGTCFLTANKCFILSEYNNTR